MRWACILLPQLALDHALRQRDDPQTPLSELEVAVVALRLDVLDLQIKQLRDLPPDTPDRGRMETELITEQFSLKKHHLQLLKSARNHIM